MDQIDWKGKSIFDGGGGGGVYLLHISDAHKNRVGGWVGLRMM